jgi:GGDEF domain-containing protein
MSVDESLDEVINGEFASIEGRVREALRRVAKAAMTCDKTGLMNMLGYERTASVYLADVERRWLYVTGDLNGLKSINTQHTLMAGDRAISHVGRLLGTIATECEAYAYHPSGDEFVLLVPPERIESFAGLVHERLARAVFRFNDKEIPVAASFGYAAPRDDESLKAVSERAEVALLIAKLSDGATIAWSDDVAARAPIVHRGRCKACNCKVDLYVPRDSYRNDLKCPNCHELI